MRFEDGHWVCTWCGARLEIPADHGLIESEHGTGETEHRRVITVDGRSVHECEQQPAPVGGDDRATATRPSRRSPR